MKGVQEHQPYLFVFGWDGVYAVPIPATTHNAAVASARHIAVAIRSPAALVAVAVATETAISKLNPEEFETKALSGACAWCHDATISSVPSNALRAPVIVANPSALAPVPFEQKNTGRSLMPASQLSSW